MVIIAELELGDIERHVFSPCESHSPSAGQAKAGGRDRAGGGETIGSGTLGDPRGRNSTLALDLETDACERIGDACLRSGDGWFAAHHGPF